MNVLIVSPWLPHPAIPHAGGQHLWQVVAGLRARGHRLAVICFGRGEPTSQVGALAARCDSLTVLTPAYTWGHKLDNLRRGGWRHPLQLGRRTQRALRSALPAVCRDHHIDVVHLAWTEMGRYLDAVPSGVGTVLATFDAEYIVRPRELALLPWGWARIGAARRVIRIEQGAVPRADVVLARSAADRIALARLAPAARIHVVPPWIGLDALLAVPPDAAVPGRCVFVGALDRVANQAAARWLLDRVWPRVQAAHPGAELWIVGAYPPRWLTRRAARDPRINVPGYVPDLAAVWAACDVALCPSLIGGGVVTKVAQAMAAGRPVVTTSHGGEGIAAPASALRVADDPGDYAGAVLVLLRDRVVWRQVAGAGRQHVRAAFDWSASLDALEAAYRVTCHLTVGLEDKDTH